MMLKDVLIVVSAFLIYIFMVGEVIRHVKEEREYQKHYGQRTKLAVFVVILIVAGIFSYLTLTGKI